MSELKQKINMVKEINDAYCKCDNGVKNIAYEVFEHPQYGQCEMLKVTFKGDAYSIRNCNGDSFSAILSEISKLVNGGYYAEVPYYKDMILNGEWKLINDEIE